MYDVAELAIWPDGTHNVERFIDASFSPDLEHCSELMQFTGLLDKNGKEIYEGDVMKLQYPLNYGFAGIHNKEIIVTVSFESGAFWFEGEGYTDCNWHFYNEYEVIGNIYQNKELL
jgi:uncharacterized phage protein (TIGR01671 family)